MISSNIYLNFFLMPSIIFIIGGIITSFLKGNLRTNFSLLVPIASIFSIVKFASGNVFNGRILSFNILGFNIEPFVYDNITLIFAFLFHLFAIFALIYSSYVKNSIEIGAGLFYIGASLGVIFAGDFLSFYIFWELLTFGAVIFIYLGEHKESKKASFRYLIFHIIGGLVLLCGILLLYSESPSLSIRKLSLNSLSTYLIFLGIGVNAGFPLLHTWITDAYHKASIVGAVFLSSLTTKVAMYALIRCFLGVEALIYIGIVMVIVPVFFAVLENDLRKVLSYSLINQLGFIVVGIGIGSDLSLSGAISQVFVHVLYKSLLFMVTGALLYKYGTCKASKLGGLYKKVPLLTIFAVIGSLSIAAFPMFSGFVAKPMILSSALENNLTLVWVFLLIGSAAVVKYFKVPYCAFFKDNFADNKNNKDNEDDVCNLEDGSKKLPICMYVSMGLLSLLCVAIGLFPNRMLYDILPFESVYNPYTSFHILTQLEILFFATLSLYICKKYNIYHKERDKITIDVDYFYRKLFKKTNATIDKGLESLNSISYKKLLSIGSSIGRGFNNISSKFNERKAPIGITLFLVILFIMFLFLI